MPSISRSVMAIGLVLLVVGVASGSWGVYQQTTDTCESGYGLTITKLEENETASSTAEHVAYSNLSATEQQVFQDILTAEETPIYQNSTQLEGLSEKIVTYRGEQYETSPLFVSDCANGWAIFKIWGGLIALLGGVIVIAASGWRRLR
jgi:hypothetical protein